ncbi:hypothetical protein [Nannocystis bainbridge]|uniref:Uncharacterized protein n=1 Tax=Nannocystis bainbridge TaxID=2995303 RepID=A0ABT5E925_9BACT|nr:hypothetical protein [Nannocystis bainbridge]MDC0721261.1 hypothetical protein [Nannocystis bainbridge]
MSGARRGLPSSRRPAVGRPSREAVCPRSGARPTASLLRASPRPRRFSSIRPRAGSIRRFSVARNTCPSGYVPSHQDHRGAPRSASSGGLSGGGLVNLARYLGAKYPDQRLGLVSSTLDVTIRFFFGYGEDECTPKTINVPAGEFEAGLVDLRDNYVHEPSGVWSTYLVGGSDAHVWTMSSRFANTHVDGVRFVDWLTDLLAGEARHVGP